MWPLVFRGQQLLHLLAPYVRATQLDVTGVTRMRRSHGRMRWLKLHKSIDGFIVLGFVATPCSQYGPYLLNFNVP